MDIRHCRHTGLEGYIRLKRKGSSKVTGISQRGYTNIETLAYGLGFGV